MQAKNLIKNPDGNNVFSGPANGNGWASSATNSCALDVLSIDSMSTGRLHFRGTGSFFGGFGSLFGSFGNPRLRSCCCQCRSFLRFTSLYSGVSNFHFSRDFSQYLCR